MFHIFNGHLLTWTCPIHPPLAFLLSAFIGFRTTSLPLARRRCFWMVPWCESFQLMVVQSSLTTGKQSTLVLGVHVMVDTNCIFCFGRQSFHGISFFSVQFITGTLNGISISTSLHSFQVTGSQSSFPVHTYLLVEKRLF